MNISPSSGSSNSGSVSTGTGNTAQEGDLGTGQFDYDDPENASTPNNQNTNYNGDTYPIYENGKAIGDVHVQTFGTTGDNGIITALGVNDYGTGALRADLLNWIQTAVSNVPTRDEGHTANVPFLDQLPPKYYNYVYPPSYLDRLYNDRDFGQELNSQFDFMFGDTPQRDPGVNYSWSAILQLVEMGPKGNPSKVLMTFFYGFESQNGYNDLRTNSSI
jgi:hypothetical protein